MKVDIIVVITVLASLSGVVIGWLGHSKTAKKEIEKNAADKATMISDIAHIKTQIDKVIVDQCKIETMHTDISLVKQTVERHEKDIEKLQKRVDELATA